jgi:hypothetical protein
MSTAPTSAERLANLEKWMRRSFFATACTAVLMVVLIGHVTYTFIVAERYRTKLAREAAESREELAVEQAKMRQQIAETDKDLKSFGKEMSE